MRLVFQFFNRLLHVFGCRAGIKSVINIQKPGEHASCGEHLDESGFSYNPQLFMDNDGELLSISHCESLVLFGACHQLFLLKSEE